MHTPFMVQFNSKCKVLNEWHDTYSKHHDYLAEFAICNESKCTIRILGHNIFTPDTNDGLIRDAIL